MELLTLLRNWRIGRLCEEAKRHDTAAVHTSFRAEEEGGEPGAFWLAHEVNNMRKKDPLETRIKRLSTSPLKVVTGKELFVIMLSLAVLTAVLAGHFFPQSHPFVAFLGVASGGVALFLQLKEAYMDDPWASDLGIWLGECFTILLSLVATWAGVAAVAYWVEHPVKYAIDGIWIILMGSLIGWSLRKA